MVSHQFLNKSIKQFSCVFTVDLRNPGLQLPTIHYLLIFPLLFDLSQCQEIVNNVHCNFPNIKVMCLHVSFCPTNSPAANPHICSDWNKAMFGIFLLEK